MDTAGLPVAYPMHALRMQTLTNVDVYISRRRGCEHEYPSQAGEAYA